MSLPGAKKSTPQAGLGIREQLRLWQEKQDALAVSENPLTVGKESHSETNISQSVAREYSVRSDNGVDSVWDDEETSDWDIASSIESHEPEMTESFLLLRPGALVQ